MIEEPRRQIENFARAGADIITIHAETSRHLHGDIGIIKKLGKKAGIAINPATPLDVLEWILDEVDMVLLMTVNPGFGGQNYISACTSKIKNLKNIILSRGLNVDIEVDGGINEVTVKEVKNAGANVIVSGSSFFKARSKIEFVKMIKE
jgi:ribulose-phosphate 3-epimerase